MSIQDRTAIWMADKLAELVKENEQMGADLKVLSEAVMESHKKRLNIIGYSCQCPACSVANKYLGGGE